MARSRVYLQVDRVAAEVCAAARTVSVSDLHESMGPVAGRQTMMAVFKTLVCVRIVKGGLQ